MWSGTYRDASTDCDGAKFNSICVSYLSFNLIHSYSIPFNIKSATFTVYFTHLREFFLFSEVTLSILTYLYCIYLYWLPTAVGAHSPCYSGCMGYLRSWTLWTNWAHRWLDIEGRHWWSQRCWGWVWEAEDAEGSTRAQRCQGKVQSVICTDLSVYVKDLC